MPERTELQRDVMALVILAGAMGDAVSCMERDDIPGTINACMVGQRVYGKAGGYDGLAESIGRLLAHHGINVVVP